VNDEWSNTPFACAISASATSTLLSNGVAY
jgi:hypothetical protein